MFNLLVIYLGWNAWSDGDSLFNSEDLPTVFPTAPGMVLYPCQWSMRVLTLCMLASVCAPLGEHSHSSVYSGHSKQFWFWFPQCLTMVNIFSGVYWISVYSLEKCLFKTMCCFKVGRNHRFFLLSCVSSLFIADIRSLSNILFVTIFSHSIGCPFMF